ncbi:MAG: peroxiredoxin family protein [Gemmatimonadota bacterium]
MRRTPFRTASILLAIALLVIPAARSGAVTLVAGQIAPGFCLKDVDGNQFSLEQFRGKTVVIAFWSTWCSRCDEELTFLKEKFGERTDVAVLLVNQDSENRISRDRVRAVREKLGIRFPVLLDEGLALWEVYGINALPTSVVVGKDGAVKLVEPNFYWGSRDNLLAAVEQS